MEDPVYPVARQAAAPYLHALGRLAERPYPPERCAARPPRAGGPSRVRRPERPPGRSLGMTIESGTAGTGHNSGDKCIATRRCMSLVMSSWNMWRRSRVQVTFMDML